MRQTPAPGAKNSAAFSNIARLVMGLIGGAAVSAAVGFWSIVAFNEATAGDVSVALSGADVSAHGGTRVTLVRRSGDIDLACNGACDDLGLDNSGRGNGLWSVEVVGSSGGRVARRTAVGFIPTGWSDTWRLGGGEGLEIVRKTVHEARR